MPFMQSLRVRKAQKQDGSLVVLVDGWEVFSGTQQECEKTARDEAYRIEGL